MLNVLQFHDCFNLSLKVKTIIEDDLLGYPIPIEVILYESSHALCFWHEVRGHFHLLDEVVNRH